METRGIKHIVLGLIILLNSQAFGQKKETNELHYLRYIEIVEMNGTKYSDVILSYTDTTINLFLSGKTIHYSKIKKIVLVKSRNASIEAMEAGAGIGYYAGSTLGMAIAFESDSPIGLFVGPAVGLVAGAIIGASTSGSDVRNKFVIKGRSKIFKDLTPMLKRYRHIVAIDY